MRSLEELRSMVADPNTCLMVACDGERIIGMASLYVMQKIDGRTSHIEDVVVSSEYRGQGIGEKLMQALIKKAREDGLHEIELTSRPSRVAARALYEKLGFQKSETDVFTLTL